MKLKKIIVIILVTISFYALAEEETESGTEPKPKAGFFKERIKNRWIKKQKNKPAPKTTIEANQKITKPGNYTIKIKSNNLDRYYILHIPPQYKSSASPLIVAMHGGGGDMNIQASDKFYKLVSKSDKEGFIIAFPNGFSKFQSGILATWNAGKCCGDSRDEKIDDVKFITEMVGNIKKQVNIDPAKVFAIGMSNGGMMAYRLACDTKNIFKAIASVTGTDITETCNPQQKVSVLHIHAKDDTHVLFNGGAGENAFKDRSKVTEFNSVPDTIKKWTKLNECPTKAKKILSVPKAYCEVYSPCKNDTEVQLCVTDDGGHSWPGGTSPRSKNKAPPSKAISANDVIWDFFKNKGLTNK